MSRLVSDDDGSDFLDMCYREIGEALGIPEGAVKSRMVTAVAALHRTLS